MKTFKFKSELQHIHNIDKRNSAFHKLTPIQMKKEIAYEALLLIFTNVVKPQCDYFYWSPNLKYLANQADSKLVQENLLQVKECEVCARGLNMLAQIRLGNSLAPNSNLFIDGLSKGNSRILKGFNMREFSAMENYYEQLELIKYAYKEHSLESLVNMYLEVILTGTFQPRNRDESEDEVFIDTDWAKEYGFTKNGKLIEDPMQIIIQGTV